MYIYTDVWQASVSKALAMDRQTVDKRPMYVSICKQKSEDDEATFKV